MYKEVVANLAAYSHNLDHGILEKDIIEDTEAFDSKLPFGELVRAEAFSFGCRPFGCNQNSIDCPLFSRNPAFFLTPLDLLIHENTHYSILWRKLQ